MHKWVLVAAAVVIVLVVLAVPTRSQEGARIGAMFDVSVLTKKLDDVTLAVKELQKQNDELKKTLELGNATLEIIAAGVGVIRTPIRWEYKFFRSSEKLANSLGGEGWEIVTIYKENWFVFRRPLPPKKEGAGEVE